MNDYMLENNKGNLYLPVISIEGIGIIYSEALKENGIYTIGDLLTVCSQFEYREKIIMKSGLSQKRLLTWLGHADLMRIDSITNQYAELLYVTGVKDLTFLATQDASSLLQKMETCNQEKNLCPTMPSLEIIEQWINKAKLMPEFIQYGEGKSSPNSSNNDGLTLPKTKKLSITSSADVMTNYLHAQPIEQQAKFQAVETSSGHGLVFCVDGEGQLKAMQESCGQYRAGFTQHNLSQNLIEQNFQGLGAKCDTFAVHQNEDDDLIQVAMVITTNEKEHLYITHNQSSGDLNWLDEPDWRYVAFDGKLSASDKINIHDVFFCRLDGQAQTMVDIIDHRSDEDDFNLISRFCVRLENQSTEDPVWSEHELPIDIQADKYQSCVGRVRDDVFGFEPDGLYTMGHVTDSSQLAFVPSADFFNFNKQGDPTLLKLPEGQLPDSIAAIAGFESPYTHLFVMSGDSLYYFSPDMQATSDSVAVKLRSDSELQDTEHLFAVKDPMSKRVTLWGKTRSHKVFHLSCHVDELDNGEKWTKVITVLTETPKLTPYINRKQGNYAMFAAGVDEITKITQIPSTGLWQQNSVTLPALKGAKATSFDAYTTTIKLHDEHGLPCSYEKVELRLPAGASLMINDLYYSFGEHPIEIESDAKGHITLVDMVKGSLSANSFTVNAVGSEQKVLINPMSEAYAKLSQLKTADKLRNAKVHYEGGERPSEPLVSADVSENELKAIATVIQSLDECHSHIELTMQARLKDSMLPCIYQAEKVPHKGLEQFGIFDGIRHAIGDLFNWIKSGIDAAVSFMQGIGEKVWYFVVTLGEKIYYGIIDTFEAVFDAFEWVFNTIKTGFEKMIQFIKFLFELDDIERTKNVLKKVINLSMDEQIHYIEDVKEQFNHHVDSLQALIADWSGNQQWTQSFGDIGQVSPTQHTKNPLENHTSSSLHLMYHFEKNAGAAEVINAPQKLSVDQDVLDRLIEDLSASILKSAEQLEHSFDNLITLIKELPSLSVGDIIQRLIGILANSTLTACQLVVNVIFDIAVLAVGSVSAMLNVELYIPVLTEILGSFSLLDVICWVAGGAYTIMYKLLNQRAPFPDNDTTAQILEAKSISEVKLIIDNADSQSFPQQTGINGTRLMSYHDEWFDFLHGTGAFVTLVNAGVSAAEAEMPPGNPLGKVSGGLAIVSGGAIGLAGVLAPKYPTQNEVVKAINLTTTVLRVISKVTFATLGLDKVQVAGAFKFVKQNDCRSVSALVDAFLVIPGVACSAWHCYELSQNGHKDSKDFKLAVLEEVSNFSFYTGRIGYTIAVNDSEEVSKNIAIVGAVAANSMAAALQAAEVGVHDSLDSSKLPHSHKVGLAKPPVSGCDLVVATGTKKLSEELIRYFITLDDAEPVALVLCDKLGGYVPLQTVVDKTNINPFLLPADANYEDPQIRTLVDELGFKGGLQFTIGIPRIPEIRELNLFNNDGLYLPFKDICVINVDASTMTVDIYGQDNHEIWLASMGNPEFVSAALDSSLDTDFFNNNPDKKATVQKAINEMGSGSFSLEQLLLNIPTIPVEECSTVLIDVPERVSSEVYTVIKAVVGALYSGEIKKHGQPVFSVQFKDTNSAFNLTDIKPRIHPDKDPQYASLDYYCGFNNHLIDDEFDMTSPWLEAGEEATLVLSRKALAEYYYDAILPYYKKMCISLDAKVKVAPFIGAQFSASFQDNQTPKSVEFPESGSVLWRMDYDDRSDDAAQAIDPISNMPCFGSMSLFTKSWCEVSIVGVTRVKVIQHLEIYFCMRDNGREAEGRVVDKTYEDVYDLGVDSEGKIKCQKSEADSHKTDNSERAHGFNNQDVTTVLAQIDPFISSLRTHDVTPYALEDMNKLVLPGADTFTYHHATFSEQQDLSCQLVFKK